DPAADLRNDAEHEGIGRAHVDPEPEPAPFDHLADPAGSDSFRLLRAVGDLHAARRRVTRMDRDAALRSGGVARLMYKALLVGDLRHFPVQKDLIARKPRICCFFTVQLCAAWTQIWTRISASLAPQPAGRKR